MILSDFPGWGFRSYILFPAGFCSSLKLLKIPGVRLWYFHPGFEGRGPLKGLSHEIDFKSFDKNLQNLALLRDTAGFWIFYGLQWFFNSKSLFIAVNASLH